MIDPEHTLPLTQQSKIVGISRSNLYDKAVPISERALELMRLIDEIHLKYPFCGSRRIRNELRDLGHDVGRGHVSTLMQKMGIRSLYQKSRLSAPHPNHKVYPYLLQGGEISRANHCGAADITYLPMARGSATSWRSWTGQAAGYWHGGCQTHWTPHSARRHLKKRSAGREHRRSFIASRAVSSPRKHLLTFSTPTTFVSAWIAEGAGEQM